MIITRNNIHIHIHIDTIAAFCKLYLSGSTGEVLLITITIIIVAVRIQITFGHFAALRSLRANYTISKLLVIYVMRAR